MFVGYSVSYFELQVMFSVVADNKVNLKTLQDEAKAFTGKNWS